MAVLWYGIIDIRLCTWSDSENRTYRLSAVAIKLCTSVSSFEMVTYRSPIEKPIVQRNWEMIAASCCKCRAGLVGSRRVHQAASLPMLGCQRTYTPSTHRTCIPYHCNQQ